MLFYPQSDASSINEIYGVRQDMIFWNEVAGVANAVFTALLTTRVLNVFVADEDRPWRTFYYFRVECLSWQILPCSTVVNIEMGARSDVEMCTHFTGSSDKVPR